MQRGRGLKPPLKKMVALNVISVMPALLLPMLEGSAVQTHREAIKSDRGLTVVVVILFILLLAKSARVNMLANPKPPSKPAILITSRK